MSQPSSGAAGTADIVSPFQRLHALLDGIEPAVPPIDLSVGGPRHPLPDFLIEKIDEAQAGFGLYPAIKGSDDFRAAIADWLTRRYPTLENAVDPDRHITGMCGTREGLFTAVFPAVRRRPDLDRPAALIPNPFYQTYAAGAQAAGAEPVYLGADAATGFLPDLGAIDPGLLARTAVMFLCSPSNPQGAVAEAAYLRRAAEIAREHDFMLFADECYSEIYTLEPPPGVLEAARDPQGGFTNLAAFHSLSKRSNLPGLRAGFCAGDGDFIEALAKFRNVVGPQLPLPIQNAAAAVWRDEAHVEANRALYREKFDLSDALLAGKFGYQRPAGGFFLWLDMESAGGSEKAVKTLWKDCGVKLLPGAYLSQVDETGANPGHTYVRVAMVAPLDETREALTRMIARLG